MNELLVLVMIALISAVMTGCAPGQNQLVNSADSEGKVAGFWYGLWHGVIAPISLIVSLFKDNVHMYEVHNNGNWYNLGFLLGMASVFGSGGGGAARARGG